MQEKYQKNETSVVITLKLTAAVAIASMGVMLLTMLGTGICMILEARPHEQVYAWLRLPLLAAGGYTAGRIFSTSCRLKGVLCGILTGMFLIGILVILRWITQITGNGLWLAALFVLISSLTGGVIGACKRG